MFCQTAQLCVCVCVCLRVHLAIVVSHYELKVDVFTRVFSLSLPLSFSLLQAFEA